MVVICSDTFDQNENYSEYFNYFKDFQLSPFQKWAIKSIVDKISIIVLSIVFKGRAGARRGGISAALLPS